MERQKLLKSYKKSLYSLHRLIAENCSFLDTSKMRFFFFRYVWEMLNRLWRTIPLIKCTGFMLDNTTVISDITRKYGRE